MPLSSFKTLSPPQKETPCLLVVTSHWPAPVAGSRSLRLSPCGCLSQWFCQWGPGHVASLTQHCFRGSPSGSGQHSVPPDVRVAFRCPVGQLCWPVHPSAHVGSRPPPAAAPCCPSPGSPGSACRPEGAGRAAAPCRLPARLETRVPPACHGAPAPCQGLRVPARAAGRAVARPGAFLRRAKPLCSFNRWAFRSGRESLRAWGPGTVSWLSLSHASVARWLASVPQPGPLGERGPPRWSPLHAGGLEDEGAGQRVKAACEAGVS